MSSTEPTPLPNVCALIERGMAEGLHIGAQLYASIDCRPKAHLAIGEARPGVPMKLDTLVPWLSSTKPVAAVATMQLVERKLLEVDDRVAKYIPAFAAHGKADITVRNLLTHTGGFREARLPPIPASWQQAIELVCAAPSEGWIPGKQAGYHPQTSWFILGELVRLLDGRDFSEYVRVEIFEPLAMHDSWVGMPVERYRAYGDRIAILPQMARRGLVPHRFSSELGATACIPGGNGLGPLGELGIFYEMLLGRGSRAGVRILREESVDAMTARHREGLFDETFRHTIDWGLGVMLDSNRYGAETVPYGYGRHASERTFGHSGNQSSAAFADPAHRLVVAVALNGMPGELKHQQRIREINSAIYEDLGLAGTG